MLKRFFDVSSSVVALILLSPLLVVLSVWIKCDSAGPVFFRQKRVGRHNRDFLLYKFRSMRVGSDRQGLITVGGHDSRVTRAGYFLRKYKLDELPQLVNVIKGDMSIVGPRPEVRTYVNGYSSEQMCVLDVRPGVTDMASIKYRNENDLLGAAENPHEYYRDVILPDKLRINMDYVASRSIWKDLRIIFLTFAEIVRK